ncbi:hypothetical protein C8Q70DRAFT_154775 [Cubamyces menziesii]|nr:hypothetical protein C8Q70DRAFT_154775 [Cubamyces menziesii]
MHIPLPSPRIYLALVYFLVHIGIIRLCTPRYPPAFLASYSPFSRYLFLLPFLSFTSFVLFLCSISPFCFLSASLSSP